MNWKEEFIRLLDDYADEHDLPAAEVLQWFSKYRDKCLIKQSIGTPCEGCKYVTRIEGSVPCYECCRNKADYYTKVK